MFSITRRQIDINTKRHLYSDVSNISSEYIRQQTTDNRQQTADSRQQTADSRQQTTDNRTIPLTQNYSTVVDAEYFSLINRHIWYAHHCKGVTYATTNIKKIDGGYTTLRLHTLVWESVHGAIPSGLLIDHLNGDSLDNRLSNLRLATIRLNTLNTKRRREGKTVSRFPRVTPTPSGKYSASIMVRGKNIYLGTYPDDISAYHAYIAYANSLNEGVLYG